MSLFYGSYLNRVLYYVLIIGTAKWDKTRYFSGKISSNLDNILVKNYRYTFPAIIVSRKLLRRSTSLTGEEKKKKKGSVSSYHERKKKEEN